MSKQLRQDLYDFDAYLRRVDRKLWWHKRRHVLPFAVAAFGFGAYIFMLLTIADARARHHVAAQQQTEVTP